MYDLLLIPRPLALAAGARFLAAGVNVERDAAAAVWQHASLEGSALRWRLRKAQELELGGGL